MKTDKQTKCLKARLYTMSKPCQGICLFNKNEVVKIETAINEWMDGWMDESTQCACMYVCMYVCMYACM